jgi:hypothetical protein
LYLNRTKNWRNDVIRRLSSSNSAVQVVWSERSGHGNLLVLMPTLL